MTNEQTNVRTTLPFSLCQAGTFRVLTRTPLELKAYSGANALLQPGTTKGLRKALVESGHAWAASLNVPYHRINRLRVALKVVPLPTKRSGWFPDEAARPPLPVMYIGKLGCHLQSIGEGKAAVWVATLDPLSFVRVPNVRILIEEALLDEVKLWLLTVTVNEAATTLAVQKNAVKVLRRFFGLDATKSPVTHAELFV